MSAVAAPRYPAHGEPCEGPPPWCRPAWIVLSRIEGQNGYSGVTELSFAMHRAVDRVNIFTSNQRYKTSGEVSAKENARRLGQANETLEAWDAEDPALPIVIDWTSWWADNAPFEKTMSGVRDKFRARNAPFVMKEG